MSISPSYASLNILNVVIQMFSSVIIFQYVLMELIKKELKSWSETLRIDNVPKVPTG